MSQEAVLTVIQRAIMAVFTASAPPLVLGLAVGIIVSLFQTITSIQEPTLAFVPKIVAVLVSLIIFGPFMLSTLKDFMISMFESIPGAYIP